MKTLRDRLIKPLPSLDAPEYIPNPTPEDGSNFILNPESNHAAVDKLFSDANIFIAHTFAAGYGYHSDSTVDTNAALIAAMTAINNIIYGNDQTMDTADAINLWLDDEYAASDLVEAYSPNTGAILAPYPELFSYFNLSYDFDDED